MDRIEKGEEVLITRHGKPVSRLVPGSGGIDRAEARAAAQLIRERAHLAGLKFDWQTLNEDRDADRP